MGFIQSIQSIFTNGSNISLEPNITTESGAENYFDNDFADDDKFTLQSEQICPSCNKSVESLVKAKRKCKQCGEFMYKRTHPYTRDALTLNEQTLKLFNHYKDRKDFLELVAPHLITVYGKYIAPEEIKTHVSELWEHRRRIRDFAAECEWHCLSKIQSRFQAKDHSLTEFYLFQSKICSSQASVRLSEGSLFDYIQMLALHSRYKIQATRFTSNDNGTRPSDDLLAEIYDDSIILNNLFRQDNYFETLDDALMDLFGSNSEKVKDLISELISNFDISDSEFANQTTELMNQFKL